MSIVHVKNHDYVSISLLAMFVSKLEDGKGNCIIV